MHFAVVKAAIAHTHLPAELHQRHLRQVISCFCKAINTVLPSVLQVGCEADTLRKQEG